MQPEPYPSRYTLMSALHARIGRWSEHEEHKLARIREACAKTGGCFELECSHTDEGDPWCIVYDHDRHRIAVHLARLERRYVVVSPRHERTTRYATIERAVDAVLDELARHSLMRSFRLRTA